MIVVVEGDPRLDNAADEEYPLVIRRKAPHNQRIEQTALRAILIRSVRRHERR